MGDYRKLEVWKMACDVSDRVDDLVETLPRRVKAALGDQVARAATGIHLNIAEGCGLNTDAQLAKYVRQALGSANEVEDALAKLQRRKLLPPKHQDLIPDAEILRKRLGALLKRLE
jgi:four helix bundle protein